MAEIISLIIPGIFFVLGIRMLGSMGGREQLDVLNDLRRSSLQEKNGLNKKQAKEVPSPGAGKVICPAFLVPILVTCSCNLIIPHQTVARLIVSILIGVALGILISESLSRRKVQHNQKKIDYFLPIVMERIVMAVESGLDVVPAIETVVGLEEGSREISDPVTEILKKIPRYIEAGIGFVEAINMLANEVSAPSFKHALVHLGLAYREGGEIIHPLRELSDATQLHFQESIEEEIAKMPIKATLPLLCTFAGLMISFLTSPLIQVLAISSKAMPK